MKKIIFAAAAALILSTSVQAADLEFKNVEIVQNPSDWNTKTAVFGPWSFYQTRQFYDRATYKDKSTYTYNTLESIKSTPAVFANVYDPIRWDGTSSSKAGLVIASNKGNNPDINWRCALETFEGKAEDDVHFVTQPRVRDCTDGVGITPVFTVPESGEYRVVTNVKNYGWTVNGSQDYGVENMARVSIIKKADGRETPENTHEFEILRKTEENPGFDSGVISLEAGDIVVLGVYNGKDGNLDDFYGTHKIIKYDGEGNEEKTYSLGDIGFSSSKPWHFYKSASNNTDFEKYIPLYAIKPENLTNAYGATGGYAALPTTDWNGGKVTMSKEASVSWNEGEEGFSVVTGNDDVLVSADIAEEGDYIVRATAQNKGMYEYSDGAVISLSALKSGQTKDTNVIGTAEIGVSSGEKITLAKKASLSAGDKVLLRVNKKKTKTEDNLKLTFSIVKIEKGLKLTCTSEGKAVSSLSEVETGKALSAKLGFLNYEGSENVISPFAAFYDENNAVYKVTALAPVTVGEYESKEFDFELTPDENTKKIIFFAWNGFNNPRVLESCAVFE